MEKRSVAIFVVALLVVAVVGFMFGSSSNPTGEATFSFARIFGFKPVELIEEGPIVTDSGEGEPEEVEPEEVEPEEVIEPSCRIFSIENIDSDWMQGKRAHEICEEYFLVCAGVYEEVVEEYLSDEGKVQAVDYRPRWLNPRFCDGEFNTKKQMEGYFSPNDYGEPYAGNVRTSTKLTSVLCCEEAN